MVSTGMILFIACLLVGFFATFVILSLTQSDVNKVVKFVIGTIVVVVALIFLSIVFAAVINTFGVGKPINIGWIVLKMNREG